MGRQRKKNKEKNLWHPNLEALVGKRVVLTVVIRNRAVVFQAAMLQKDEVADNMPSMRIPVLNQDQRIRPREGEVWTGRVSEFDPTRRYTRIKNAQRRIIEVTVTDLRRVKEKAIRFHKGNLSLVRKKSGTVSRDSVRATKEIVQFRMGKSIVTYTEVRVSGKPVARFHRKTRKIRLPKDNNIPQMPNSMKGEMAYLPWEQILAIARAA